MPRKAALIAGLTMVAAASICGAWMSGDADGLQSGARLELAMPFTIIVLVIGATVLAWKLGLRRPWVFGLSMTIPAGLTVLIIANTLTRGGIEEWALYAVAGFVFCFALAWLLTPGRKSLAINLGIVAAMMLTYACAAVVAVTFQPRWRASYFDDRWVPKVLPVIPGLRPIAADTLGGLGLRLAGEPGGPYDGLIFEAGVHFYSRYSGEPWNIKVPACSDAKVLAQNVWRCGTRDWITMLRGEYDLSIYVENSGNVRLTDDQWERLARELTLRPTTSSELGSLPPTDQRGLRERVQDDMDDFWFQL